MDACRLTIQQICARLTSSRYWFYRPVLQHCVQNNGRGGKRKDEQLTGAREKAAFDIERVAGDIGPLSRFSGQVRVEGPDARGKWMVLPLPRWAGMAHRPSSLNAGVTAVGVMWLRPCADVTTDFASQAQTT